MTIDGAKTVLGPMLRDDNGNLLSVVPARGMTKGQSIFVPGSQARVGEYTGHRHRETFLGDASVVGTLGLVKIDPQANLSDIDSLATFTHVGELADSLGHPVLKLGRNGQPNKSGRLTGVLSTFILLEGEGSSRRLYGAIEIESDDDQFAMAGDAGASIVSEDGALLGLIIAKVGSITIAVPIADFLQLHELQLADRNVVEAHNRKAAPPAQDILTVDSSNIFKLPLAAFYGGQAALDAKAGMIAHWRPARMVTGLVDDKTVRFFLGAFDPNRPEAAPTGKSKKIRTPAHISLDKALDAAPRTHLRVLSEKLREAPQSVIEEPGIAGVRLNYVSGLEPALSGLKLRRQDFALRMIRHCSRTSSADAAFEMMHRHFDRIGTTEFGAIAHGRAVSMETVLICVFVVDRMAAQQGIDVDWQDAYVEPAVFAVQDEDSELSSFFTEDPKAMRAVEERFRTWSNIAPMYKGHSISKLVEEAAKGRAMRFRTARLLDESVSEVFGKPLHWRAVSEYEHDVIASTTDDRMAAHG